MKNDRQSMILEIISQENIETQEQLLVRLQERGITSTQATISRDIKQMHQVPPTLPGLADNGVTPDEDGNLLLQREIGGDGKNVCRANGRPLTVTQLRQIGGELLNIHGQHDGQQLLDEEQHGAYLDRFGRMEAPLAAYRSAYDAMAAIRDQIRSLQMNEAEKARRMDSLRFQIDELERAELVSGEEEELNARRELLRNGESILPPCPGPITVSAAMTTVQARSQPSGRQRRPFGASAPSVMSWVSYTNGWNPFAVKYMTLPRRFGINGQNLPFLPRSWTPRRPGLTSFTA